MPPKLRPMVFVAMPFGKKRDPSTGIEIDFDAIYRDGIQPAAAGLDVDLIRADEERGGGIVHTPMFERLLISEIAIVDVTVENANVFYELGVRHTARPRSTIIMRAAGTQMPFDIKLIRAVTYHLENGKLTPESAADLVAELSRQLAEAQAELSGQDDSPLFQLIPQYKGIVELNPDVEGTFRERAKTVIDIRQRLSITRTMPPERGRAAIDAIRDELGAIQSVNAESALDVLFAYRDVEAYDRMIAFVATFPDSLKNNTVVREQLGLALNRQAAVDPENRTLAIEILDALVAERGDSSETCGIIGRIYKDLFEQCDERDKHLRAEGRSDEIDPYETDGHLETAIGWYRRGFNADPRDYYPGINLLTLLAVKGTRSLSEGERQDLEREVRRVAATLSFALARIDAPKSNDYWVLATLIEASVHDGAWSVVDDAMKSLSKVKVSMNQLNTTTRNLRVIAKAALPQIDAARLDRLIAVFDGRMRNLQSSPPAA